MSGHFGSKPENEPKSKNCVKSSCFYVRLVWCTFSMFFSEGVALNIPFSGASCLKGAVLSCVLIEKHCPTKVPWVSTWKPRAPRKAMDCFSETCVFYRRKCNARACPKRNAWEKSYHTKALKRTVRGICLSLGLERAVKPHVLGKGPQTKVPSISA